jgi:hypothetical protein
MMTSVITSGVFKAGQGGVFPRLVYVMRLCHFDRLATCILALVSLYRHSSFYSLGVIVIIGLVVITFKR